MDRRDRLVELLDKLQVGFAALSADGAIHYANPKMAEFAAMTPADMEGRDAQSLMDHTNYRVYLEQFEQRRRGSNEPYSVSLNSRVKIRVFPTPIIEDDCFLGSCVLVVADSGAGSSEQPSTKVWRELGSAVMHRVGDPATRVGAAPEHAIDPDLARRLSTRERQVSAQLAAGHSVQAIAGGMGLQPSTIRTHLRSIYAKYGVRTRLEFLGRYLAKRDE